VAERLAALGASVVGARLFTSQRGLALDVFYLQDASGKPFGHHAPHELDRLCRAIEDAARDGAKAKREPEKPWRASGSYDIAPTVVVDNEATDAATIVEVSGRDRPGLLAALARRLTAAELSIQSAHIENYGHRAVDAFYVLTEKGQKLTGAKDIEALKAALTGVFSSSPAKAAV
jgi:[protein-PII] uridylyltransferase